MGVDAQKQQNILSFQKNFILSIQKKQYKKMNFVAVLFCPDFFITSSRQLHGPLPPIRHRWWLEGNLIVPHLNTAL